jgi:hypothetical protein
MASAAAAISPCIALMIVPLPLSWPHVDTGNLMDAMIAAPFYTVSIVIGNYGSPAE